MTEQSYCQGLLHGFSKDCYMYKKGKLKSSDSTSPILWLELINIYHPWFVAITKKKEPIYSIGSFGYSAEKTILLLPSLDHLEILSDS